VNAARLALASPLLAALVALGCAGPKPAPLPFRGPAPRSVLVAPAVGADETQLGRRELDAELGRVLSARGYETIPADVARRVLASLGLQEGGDPLAVPLERLLADYDVDAVLATRVVGWEYDLEAQVFRCDLATRLVATANGSELWADGLTGAQQLREERTVVDPVHVEDPILERDPLPFTHASVSMSPSDVARWAAEGLLRRLPAAR
jgi:hypothetical protein